MLYSLLVISWESSTPHFLGRLLCHDWWVRSLPSSGVQLARHWIPSYVVVSCLAFVIYGLHLNSSISEMVQNLAGQRKPIYCPFLWSSQHPWRWGVCGESLRPAGLSTELAFCLFSLSLGAPCKQEIYSSNFSFSLITFLFPGSTARCKIIILLSTCLMFLGCTKAGLIPWKSSLQRGSGCFKNDINKKTYEMDHFHRAPVVRFLL